MLLFWLSASPTGSTSAVSNLNTTSLSEISQAIQLDPNSTESTGSIANANQPANLTTSASNCSLDDVDVAQKFTFDAEKPGEKYPSVLSGCSNAENKEVANNKPEKNIEKKQVVMLITKA
ncbi:hypothetical protein PGT21_012588 [Puccinia graminis f. sp. tritici]|uniref:Uncharacterized protein n=1 Tax=Puccinia graminis f. sp. tritici TaxID=56615 RepID=A0A5B0QA97_PUCGR|nr:hypothetical protein PGT21_012588 [Puccinia graminis f. sp. tritici]